MQFLNKHFYKTWWINVGFIFSFRVQASAWVQPVAYLVIPPPWAQRLFAAPYVAEEIIKLFQEVKNVFYSLIGFTS